MIRQWKQVDLKDRTIYQGPKPIPLYTTWDDGVYCNVFSDAAEEKTIYSFYNENYEDVDTAVELWHPGEAVTQILGQSDPELRKNKLHLHVPARQVVHVLVEER